VRLARAHKGLGLYDKALGFYKKAESIRPLDISSNIQMAILLLEETNQTAEARRIIESESKKMNSGDPLRVDSQVALGLSYLKEGNYSKSEEVFQSVLFADENQKEARLNVGISKMLRSDFSGALKDFNFSLRKGSGDGILILSRAIAHLGLNEGIGDASHLKSSVEDMERYITSASEYRLEALLLKAVLLQKLGNKEQALKTAARLLEEDPHLTQDHIHSLLIDRQLVRWDRLAMYCDFLSLKWGDSAISRGLSAFCTYQRQELQPSLTKLEDALGQFPKSTELLSQQSYVLLQQKRIADAQRVANLVEAESALAQRVLALSCEELGNWDCADQKWRRIILGNGEDLGALRGLAQYHWMKSHREQALGFIKTGLSVSSSYRPLRELQEKLDAH
jgi:tetratricopeptide (TPR) repeat protein